MFGVWSVFNAHVAAGPHAGRACHSVRRVSASCSTWSLERTLTAPCRGQVAAVDELRDVGYLTVEDLGGWAWVTRSVVVEGNAVLRAGGSQRVHVGRGFLDEPRRL